MIVSCEISSHSVWTGFRTRDFKGVLRLELSREAGNLCEGAKSGEHREKNFKNYSLRMEFDTALRAWMKLK